MYDSSSNNLQSLYTGVLRASSIVLGFTFRNLDGILKTLNIIINFVIDNSKGNQNKFHIQEKKKKNHEMYEVKKDFSCSNKDPHN